MSPSGPSTSNYTNLSSSLDALSNNVRKEARNLCVIFDSELSFDTQVIKVVKSCFAQLRQLTKIRSFLSSADLEKVIHAFISSRLDYCNALYSGISRRNIQRLQSPWIRHDCPVHPTDAYWIGISGIWRPGQHLSHLI